MPTAPSVFQPALLTNSEKNITPPFDDQFITTEEITLKSVNEVGLFLYFGGTNSWLQLQDPDGKTIHDWTVVQ
jgi:hypothetical protein